MVKLDFRWAINLKLKYAEFYRNPNQSQLGLIGQSNPLGSNGAKQPILGPLEAGPNPLESVPNQAQAGLHQFNYVASPLGPLGAHNVIVDNNCFKK